VIALRSGLKKWLVKLLLVNIEIRRTELNQTYTQNYEVKVSEPRTVLGVLLEIQANKDPSLAFRFGCRFKHCGLCAIDINGRAFPSCLHQVDSDLKLAPLKNFPILQDLIIDRHYYHELLQAKGAKLPLYPVGGEIKISRLYKKLMSCTECFCCLAECSRFGEDSNFLGPLYYVKLAQAYLNPCSRGRLPDLDRDDLQACLDCAAFAPMMFQ